MRLCRQAVDHAVGERGGLRTQIRCAALRAAAFDEARPGVSIAPAQLVPDEQRQYGAHLVRVRVGGRVKGEGEGEGGGWG